MEALDLSQSPPRSPYVELGGVLLLARTIDKIRATLPGGNLGAYRIAGFSSQLLDKLGINEDDLRAVVALANTEADVLAWVQKHSDPSTYRRINEHFEAQTVGQRGADYFERYPLARSLPGETTLLRVLELDDARSFDGI